MKSWPASSMRLVKAAKSAGMLRTLNASQNPRLMPARLSIWSAPRSAALGLAALLLLSLGVFPAAGTSSRPPSAKTRATPILLKIRGDSPGRTFDGIGAVSAGGSSRLLLDYPERERNQILDYLFKPNYGAALQILKVEIGSDTDSTDGPEPAHQRAPGDLDCHRGYEWWLMREAKARNPEIKYYALAWGAPGWLRGGFWSDDNIQYTLSWLECAKRHGFQIDYLGGGNERGWDAAYYIKLAQALKEHGYANIKIVATDDHHPPDYWAPASEMLTNTAFAEAVNILGEHDVCGWRTLQEHCHVSQEALALNRPLWDSENSTQDFAVGHEPLARVLTRHYIDGRITGNLNWAPVAAYYSTFPVAGTGMILAEKPWSGSYSVGRSVWVDAHMTQFTKPGWRYLDDACGYTPGGASYTALRSTDNTDYTILIESLDLRSPEVLELEISHGLSTGTAHLWSTALRSENPDAWFVHLGNGKPKSGRYQIELEPGHLYTVSTTSGQRKGDAHSSAAPDKSWPLPWSESFEQSSVKAPTLPSSAGAARLARFFSDAQGAFEIAPCAGGRTGRCYRQAITRQPIVWQKTKMPPTTIAGDPSWWGDYEVSVDALLEQPGYVELLGRIESQQHNAAGYHLRVSDSGNWRLFSQNVKGNDTELAAGKTSGFGTNSWHRLSLHFLGSSILARFDGADLARVRDDSHTLGQIGFSVSPWQQAQFDNLQVVPTASPPHFIPRSELSAGATSEHMQNDFGQIHAAQDAIDGRPETFWRSEVVRPQNLPQSITIKIRHARVVTGLVYRPPLQEAAHVITKYNIYTSLDERTYSKVASGIWPANIAAKTVSWPPGKARFIRLEALDAPGGPTNTVGAAELGLLSYLP